MNKSSLLHISSAISVFILSAVIAFALTNMSKDTLANLETTLTEIPSETETEIDWLTVVDVVYDEYETKIEHENFKNVVIIGNSQAQALSNYGLIKEADFLTRIGLSINKVLTSSDGNPVINGLYGKSYDKIIFVFGENELGWPYPKNFITEYKKVINAARNILPDAEIYCHAVFPVSRSHSEKSTTGITNENVALFNGLIKEMCDEDGYTFIDYSPAFSEDNGALPENVASDGIHFNYDYCKIWASDLSSALSEE